MHRRLLRLAILQIIGDLIFLPSYTRNRGRPVGREGGHNKRQTGVEVLTSALAMPNGLGVGGEGGSLGGRAWGVEPHTETRLDPEGLASLLSTVARRSTVQYSTGYCSLAAYSP